MRTAMVIMRRELRAYFATPLAYIFIVIFLALAGAFTFFLGNFFERGQADLTSFFVFHPWLYLFLVPAVAMRLWAEERKAGTIEVLLTLPVTPGQAVVAKFLAAWIFLGIALALTVPLWLTVAWLGSPDSGVIAAGYLGSFVLAGAYLAIGAAVSALARNQVTAFVGGAALCFALTAVGSPLLTGLAGRWAPPALVEALASISVLGHFNAVLRGVVDLRDVLFFASLIALFLFVNRLAVEGRAGS